MINPLEWLLSSLEVILALKSNMDAIHHLENDEMQYL